ncbi:lysine N(6)-hydroxylase/L-ornithine N(5)-oxygenase family protein [Micromonospora matsumotoense]|uniref:lysine N(6)-hydroxylase/L-ornithine N(5)-oxygenase family protein n=1 Tax=Micromonospora matsumotoense TaxID=121616 RepID=UPI003D8FD5E8
MTQTYHTVGIGAGPANLSLAAMYGVLAPHEIALFESRDQPGWHDGMLHSGVRMQTGWVKDLVSLYDPTHPLSFLNYLVTTGRVYALLGAGFDTIPRIEYQQYLGWAAAQLPNIVYGTRIDRVDFDGELVSRSGDVAVARSRHLVLGTGTVPFLPDFLAALDPRHVFVADELHHRLSTVADEPDAPWIVMGSGQTSAECVAALLARGVRDIRWIGRRSWFAPLEDSPSANDLYRPAYQEAFLTLSRDVRERLVSGQILTSDGISPGTLRGIYQHNYEERLRTGRFPVTIMPSRTVTAARQLDGEIELECLTAGSGEERHRAVHLVVAAGRQQAPLPFDEELTALVDIDERGQPVIESDYSIRWKHADQHKIFVLNRGRYVQGLVDSNLSILPVRSAMVLNSIAGRVVCPFRDEFVSTRWA